MPEGDLRGLITRSAVIREFYKHEGSVPIDESLIHFVLNSAQKLMAITVLAGVDSSGLHTAMKIFQAREFDDKKLPIISEDFPCASQLEWSDRTRTEFKRLQWMFLVPVLDEDFVLMAIREECILPFRLAAQQPGSEQHTMSPVCKVEINEAHIKPPLLMVHTSESPHLFSLTSTNYEQFDGSEGKTIAAVEKFEDLSNDSTLEAWKTAKKILIDISQACEPHILDVKGVIEWEGIGNYLIYQWADGGTLRRFFEMNTRPVLDAVVIRECVYELVGIAGALVALHKRGYRHGNLKPDNIVRFDCGTRLGHLKISGFSLATASAGSTAATRPKSTLTDAHYGTRLYEAPALDFPLTLHSSQRDDLWPMGCIVLEIIIWLLYGNGELMEFNKSLADSSMRGGCYWALTDNEEGHQEIHVNTRVVAYMEIIKRDPECAGATAMSDLLKLVEEKLLVVPLTNHLQTGHTGITEFPRTRVTAYEFQDSLLEIDGRVDESEEYIFTNTPRDGTLGPLTANTLHFSEIVENQLMKDVEVCKFVSYLSPHAA